MGLRETWFILLITLVDMVLALFGSLSLSLSCSISGRTMELAFNFAFQFAESLFHSLKALGHVFGRLGRCPAGLTKGFGSGGPVFAVAHLSKGRRGGLATIRPTRLELLGKPGALVVVGVISVERIAAVGVPCGGSWACRRCGRGWRTKRSNAFVQRDPSEKFWIVRRWWWFCVHHGFILHVVVG